MRPTTRRALLLLPSALATSSCQERPIQVEPTGTPDRVTISAFDYRGPFDLFRSPASIASIAVWPKDTQDAIWQAYSVDECTTNVHAVQYGVVPNGFEQVVTPGALVEGVVYAVYIEDCSGLRSGGAYFDLADGHVRWVSYATLVR